MFAGRFSPSIGSVGIDIGTRAAKVVQIREHGGGLEVVGAGRVELRSPPTDADGRRDLTDQLRGAFASGGFTGRRCVVSLPRRDVHMQSVRLPKMPDAELRQAAVWEAAQRFGFERNEMEVDIIRTGASVQGENREEVLLVAVSHEAIHTWVEPIMAAGLRPLAVETGFTAAARIFGQMPHQGPDDDVRAVVDVGVSGSTVSPSRPERS